MIFFPALPNLVGTPLRLLLGGSSGLLGCWGSLTSESFPDYGGAKELMDLILLFFSIEDRSSLPEASSNF